MAEYTLTTPIVRPDKTGYSLDSITINRDGTVDAYLAEKDAGDATIRVIGPIRIKAAGGGTDAIIPAASRTAIRTWIWARIDQSLASAGHPALEAGTGT
jgi:hypothetical protein